VEDLLDDPNVHVVSICTTPHHMHVVQGVAAAKASKHLVLEKPMALDLAGLHELQAAVRTTKVKTVASSVLRWNPLFEMIESFLPQGMIGNLFLAEVDYLHGIGPWYAQYD
jgi:predicted dehydrogenase